MNRGRINRRQRDFRRGPEFGRRAIFCLRCLQFGHYRQNCKNDPIVTCGSCFRAYHFCAECPCSNRNNNAQTLRLVGGQRFSRPCIDVTIGSESFEAFINQSSSQTTINSHVLNHINSIRQRTNLPPISCPGTVQFGIKRRQREVTLDLEAREQQTDAVILGNDFLSVAGFSLTLDRVTINERSPVVENCRTVDFLYNMPQGDRLKSWLERNHRPLYNQYMKGDEPTLQNQPVVEINNDQYDGQDEAGALSDADVLDIHPENDDLGDFLN